MKWSGELLGAVCTAWSENPFRYSSIFPLVAYFLCPVGRYWLVALLWDHLYHVALF